MRPRTLILAVFSIVLLLMITVVTVFASPIRIGPNMTYIYRVEERGDGTLKASVSIPAILDDPVTMPRYRETNTARSQALIEQGTAESIYVQVTFARPVSWEEARALSHAAGLAVDSYLMVGAGSQGEKATVIYNRSLDDEAPPDTDFGPRGQVTTLRGVMVLQGRVPATREGLGQLLNDSQIYMVDTTAVEVRRAIKSNPLWQDREIVSIGLPSPFWSLVWGNGN